MSSNPRRRRRRRRSSGVLDRFTVSSHSLVMVVDDDPSIVRLVQLELTEQGFRVVTATSGNEAIEESSAQHPDLVVLDIGLPDISGYEVLRRLRERAAVPIILLTARDADADKVRGLEMGADDYLPKPFNPEELSARVRAVLRRERRPTSAGSPIVRTRDLEIDLERRLVTRNGEIVSLTRTEWNLLQELAGNAGKVMMAAEILSKVWGPEYRDDVQYLRVWVSRLRGKLEPGRHGDSVIRTFPGMGYMFEANAPVGDPEPATTVGLEETVEAPR